MPALNWIVPCRRAVVRQTLSYADASNAWKASLEAGDQRNKLTAWYDIVPGEYDEALVILTQFIDRFFNAATPQAEAESRLDDPVRPCETSTEEEPIYDDFCVRLWKGPLRVLREAGGGLPPPILNASKQVVHRSTDFYPGDVIEFPLAIFLFYAGRTEFGSARFNAAGSFLLGNAVSGCAGAARLHDNLLAMKFQLLFNLALGTFYHTGAPQSVGFSSTVDGEAISSRGMIYGGTFGNATVGGRGGWRVVTNHWGAGGPQSPPELRFPYNLPSPASISGWQAGHMLTSGWACVTSTLFLTNYMFSNVTDYGDGGVHLMIQRANAHPLRDRFIHHAASDTNQAAVDGADMCVFCKGDHEYAVIKIYPAENLLRPNVLPTQGFICAYHPLDGAPQTSSSGGELFLFEASGQLGRWRRSTMYSVFAANRFIWEAVGSSSRGLFRPDLDAWYATPPANAARSLGQDTSLTSNLRPIWISGMAGPVVRNYQSLYADRAVPFPTMAEAQNKFPRISEVLPRITTARNAVWRSMNGQIPGVRPNSTYQALLPALEPAPPEPAPPSSA